MRMTLIPGTDTKISLTVLLKPCTIRFFFLLCIGIFTIAGTNAQTIQDSVKSAENELRQAEKSIFEGKNDVAGELLSSVDTEIETIKSQDPENKKIKSLEGKLAKLKKDLEKKTGAPKIQPADIDVQGKNAYGNKSGAKPDKKLSSSVAHRLKQIDGIIKKSERIMRDDFPGGKEGQVAALQEPLKQIKDLASEIEAKFAGQFDPENNEYLRTKMMINEFEAKIANLKTAGADEKEKEIGAQEKSRAFDAEWLAAFNPYMTAQGQPGYDPEKYFIAGYTAEKNDMQKRIRQFVELSSLFEEYKKEVPANHGDELLQTLKKVEYSLNSFANEKGNMLKFNLDQIDCDLKDAEDFLEKQKNASTPICFEIDQLVSIRKKIENASLSAQPSDTKITEFNKRFDEIIKADKEIKKKRLASIRIRPDCFGGSESKAIKAKAEEIVKAKNQDAKILKTNIVGKDWNEENVIEYTDTTQSAIRFRTTRNITVQVAAKNQNGCFVYTLDVSKDKNNDGKWGGLNSHIMFTDEILEENL